MKKLSIPLMIMFFFCAGFVNTVKAQWTDYKWETYGIDFKAPTDFTLKQNDHAAFTANGAIFTMSIKPWEDASVTDPMAICQKALDITPGTDKTVIKEVAIEDLNGLNGYEAYCTATQSGKLMHMVIGGYLDPGTSTNFTVQLLFWDDAAENETNYEAALYILKSFKAEK
jgi:hypothetical protein